MGEAKAVEYLQAFRNRRNWRSFTQTAEQALDLSGRKVDVFGGENIPFCGQIWAVNHTARVDDPVNMTGRLVVPDMLDIVGVLSRETRKRNKRMFLVMTDTPQLKALFPKHIASPREVLEWITKDAKYGGANVLRTIMLRVYGNADDLLVSRARGVSLDMVKRATTELTKNNNIVTLFPEGKTTVALERGSPGLGFIRRHTRTPIVPVSQYDEDGRLQVHFGRPIVEDTGKDDQRFTDIVMRAIAGQLPPHLRGVYGG